MPLYEYECNTCHRRTEKIQKFSDAELTVCPHCGGPLERTITAAAMVFKGGGWYADGYASHKKAESGESSSSDSSGGSESGSSSESGGGSSSVDNSSATMKASSGDSGKSESSKPAESAKPAAASPAPAASSSAKD